MGSSKDREKRENGEENSIPFTNHYRRENKAVDHLRVLTEKARGRRILQPPKEGEGAWGSPGQKNRV